MLPVEKFSGGSIENLVLYLSVIGILLFVATLLRLKISFLRKAFVPAPLIAGVIGLILGPYVLGVFSPEMRSSFGALPSTLIVVVFATMLLGVKQPKIKESFLQSAPSIFQSYMYSFIQVGLTCLVTALILTPAFGTNPMFGSVIEVGFMGGHGTAGGMSGVYESLGWAAGADVGQTTATVGLIAGIFGGIFLINVAVKRGYTTVLTEPKSLNVGDSVHVDEEKKPSSYSTISHDVVESFAFHAGLIGIAIYIGYGIVWAVETFFAYSLPLFPFAMIGGWVLNGILQKTSVAKLIDRETLQRIQGLCMDFLIVAAVASVSIPVVVEYWQPLLISCVLLTFATVAVFWFISPRIYKENWFECGIVRYGTATGVAAIGLMLLRTADPEMKTNGGKIYALSSPFCSPFVGGGFLTTAYPSLILTWGSLQCGLIFMGMFVVMILLCMVFRCWNRKPDLVQRGKLPVE